jgi:hypothetical protein
MWEVALGTFTIVTTIAALAYARHAHRQSLNAPILKLALYHPASASHIEAPKQPCDIVLLLNRGSFNIAIATPDGKALGFPLPIIIRNVGTKTARDIILRVRHSILLKVASNGQPIEDVDRPEWLVIDHAIPDLNPKQAHKLIDDYLLPTDALENGLASGTWVTTKDKRKVYIKFKAEFTALIEILLYSADTEPIFMSCRVKIKADEETKS